MKTVSITVEVPLEGLTSYTDAAIAEMWHVAQANPAPHGDCTASELVGQLSFEITRRFLERVGPELYRRQARDCYFTELNDLRDTVEGRMVSPAVATPARTED